MSVLAQLNEPKATRAVQRFTDICVIARLLLISSLAAGFVVTAIMWGKNA
jgi:competence protein ComGF